MCGGGIDCVDFFDGPPDSSLLDAHEIDDYLQHSFLPWARRNDELIIAVADTSNTNLSWLAARYGGHLRLVPVEWTTITAAIENVFREQLTHDAVYGLADAEPHLCARETITRKQIVIFSALAATIIVVAIAWPAIASAGLAIVLTIGYLANIMFRTSLVWVGAKETAEHTPSPAAHIPDLSLPRYTVMVPLYREANILPSLIGALRALDYPPEQLDIKIVVEADDAETFAAACALDLLAPFEIIRVPDHQPRTKPAACNYALRLARGEFTVIFDAEDRPEPDQLRKAVAAFRACPPEVGCLQARLNFYNANENWLTRLFTLDYSLWFDFLLPGLDRLHVPMPLGGTSNHFRTSVLRAIHGWDAFNVTEDADLGIRLARLGYRAMTLDSTTFEEATNRVGNWVKQRSRWLKGYMQTWLVHMRDPVALFRHAGFRGAMAFQLFIGGAITSALINPLLWCVFIASHVWGAALLGPAFNATLAHASLVSLITGNTLFTYLAMLGPYRRGWLELTPYGLTAPFYWLLISIAAYRALWQLITRPFHWEKTQHGTSAMA